MALPFSLALLLGGMFLLEPARALSGPMDAPAKPVVCLGSRRYRHPVAIEHADLSADGRTLFTLSEKGVFVWDLQTGVSRFLFEDVRLRNALRLSPDGKQLLSISRDEAAIWDTRTGKEIKRFEGCLGASTGAFTPDGKGVLIFRDGRIEYWGLAKGVRRLGETAKYHAPVFSPDGKWFAVAASGEPLRDVVIYDAKTLKRKAVLTVGATGFGPLIKLEGVLAGFAPEGDRLAVPGKEGGIRLWDIAAAKEVRILGPKPEKTDKKESEYRFILFSSDGKRLFAGTAAGAIRHWDVESGAERSPLRAHHKGITSLHLTADGKRLTSTDEDGMIRRWNAVTGEEFAPPDGYSGDLHGRLSPDGRSALLLDGAGRMDAWDLRGGRLRTRVRPTAKAAIDTPWIEPLFGFLPDGKRVYLAETNGKITVWNTTSGKRAASFELKGYTERGGHLRFCVAASDGRSFAVNRRRRVVLIDAASGKDIWESPELSARAMCYPPAFSPDGKTLYLGVATHENKPYTELRGKLELVRLAAATGKIIDRTRVPTDGTGDLMWFEQPRLTSDGRSLILAYGVSEVNIADATLNKIRHHYVFILDQCALSPDGKWFVGADLENLRVRETATGKELYRLPIGKQTVQSLHILPDGRRVLVTGSGGLACVWELKLPASISSR